MPTRKPRNISLAPELEPFAGGRVASARHHSASNAVRAVLCLPETGGRGRDLPPPRKKPMPRPQIRAR
jgi:hypothetical protein